MKSRRKTERNGFMRKRKMYLSVEDIAELFGFCSLEEKGVQERREQQVAELKGNREITKQPTVQSKAETNKTTESVTRSTKQEVRKASVTEKGKKLSIHERLEINKKKIQEKQGKDEPERGADRGVR